MTREEYADRLAEVASELVTRVRDEDPNANRRWLHAMLPDPADREALLYVLAAAVPDDRTWRDLTAWATKPAVRRGLRPCGTPAAAERHRYRKEPLCDLCRNAERKRDRDRKEAAYWAKKSKQPAASAA